MNAVRLQALHKFLILIFSLAVPTSLPPAPWTSESSEMAADKFVTSSETLEANEPAARIRSCFLIASCTADSASLGKGFGLDRRENLSFRD